MEDSLYSSELVSDLHQLLLDLHTHPYPETPSTDSVKKRAAVAVIIRIQPHNSEWPSQRFDADTTPKDNLTTAERLRAFFSQDWVKHGEPEILFIKRASRKGDRWNAHIAFPGGKRDPEDVDDHATAVRETWEEVGVDLNDAGTIRCGNLAQKVITSHWGKVPELVFCPYIFLLTKPIPPMRLQPKEVASVHWVPIRAMLDPGQRAYWAQEIRTVGARKTFGLSFGGWIVPGKVLFAALHLKPSESKYCTETEEYLGPSPPPPQQSSLNITVPLFNSGWSKEPENREAMLLMWGLTLGVVGDFIDMLPPFDKPTLSWVYPSFTSHDFRLVLWLMSYTFRRKRDAEWLTGQSRHSVPMVQQGMDIIGSAPDMKMPNSNTTTGNGRRYYGRVMSDLVGSRSQVVGDLLEGYYGIMKKAVIVAAAGRLSVLSYLTYMVWSAWRRTRSRL